MNSVAFSPDCKTHRLGSDDDTLRLWDAKSRKPIGEPLKGHEGWVAGVAFSPDGTCIVSGRTQKTLRLWRVKSGEPIV